MENKFTRSGDLQTFQKKVMKHFVAHGLDAITYVASPTNTSALVSVLEHHALFSLKQGIEEGNDTKARYYDAYDRSNDLCAKEYLYNSVDVELEKQLLENCKDEDSFVAVWLNLIHLIRSVSIDRFDKVKERLKRRKAGDYSGENIESLVSDYLSDYKDLHDHGGVRVGIVHVTHFEKFLVELLLDRTKRILVVLVLASSGFHDRVQHRHGQVLFVQTGPVQVLVV